MSNITVYLDGLEMVNNVDTILNLKREIECLEIDNHFMLCLLREIESGIDHGDQQQISCAIRQLRGQLGTDKLINGSLKPGLIRE